MLYLASEMALSIASWITLVFAADSLGIGTANTIPLFNSNSWFATNETISNFLVDPVNSYKQL